MKNKKPLVCPHCNADYHYLRLICNVYMPITIHDNGMVGKLDLHNWNEDDVWENINDKIPDDPPEIHCKRCGTYFDAKLDYQGIVTIVEDTD